MGVSQSHINTVEDDIKNYLAVADSTPFSWQLSHKEGKAQRSYFLN